MICVSLGRTRHAAFLEAHRYLGDHKAELVELRVDWLRKRPDIGRLLKDRPTPVVVTCRRKEDKGMWSGEEAQRLTVLREAIMAGADYVDLEIDIAKSVPRYGTTKRIVSYHNFEETPIELHDIHQRMAECDPDIVKLVTMAKTPADNVRILELLRTVTVPTVAFCMGEFGTISRLLCGQWGAPFTYAGFSSEREMAPGQLTFAEVRNLYRYNRITPETKIFGVIGDPIGHSLSPLLHNAAFRKVGFDGVYLPLKIPAESLLATLQEYETLNISGYSVTIPHKEHVLDYVESPDSQADLIGAANTLFRKDDTWQATNTDFSAIVQTVTDALAASPGRTPELVGKRVLVLGSGGVARAAVCAMQAAGAEVVVSNRTRERARQLASELDCESIDWAGRGTERCDILINGTSVGMHPKVDESPFEERWLKDTMLVFDTVYTPENTLLLKQARQQGCSTASGLNMFVLQAAKQFELFTGQAAPVDYMVETLRRGLSVA
ncbi:MAG: shikimate dehydrogenase [Planctomycetaceae bacterium]